MLSMPKSELSEPLAKPSFFKKIRQGFIEVRMTFRESGLKAVARRYGWKVFAAFFVYYLVRDLILYIALPWLMAHQFAA